MTDPDAFARIHVTDHVIERARERLGWDESDEQINSRIRIEIRAALLVDRIATVRPNWSRGPHAEELTPRSGYHYVWDADTQRCWVIETRVSGVVRVKTVVPAVAVAAAESEQRNIRKGMKRS